MNIGIIGYGRMGHEVALQALRRGHSVLYKVDPHNTDADAKTLSDIDIDALMKTDVLIEFSLASAVLENARLYSYNRIPAVIGTTGWDEHSADVSKLMKTNNTVGVYAANFSIGAHVFTRIAEYAARIINKLPHYDAGIWEIHHRQKKDRPSGTALMMAQRVMARLKRKKYIETDIPHDSPLPKDALALVSQRIGAERGFHELILDSDVDTIKLSHTARTREGFALGAVLSAEWIASIHTSSTAQESSPYSGLLSIDAFIDTIISDAFQDKNYNQSTP